MEVTYDFGRDAVVAWVVYGSLMVSLLAYLVP